MGKKQTIERLSLCSIIYVHSKFRTQYYVLPLDLLGVWNHYNKPEGYIPKSLSYCTLKINIPTEQNKENRKA